MIRRLLCFALLLVPTIALAGKPISIGNRLELFVDDFLVQATSGDLKQQLHRPEPKEVVLTTGKPWEGNTCAYYTIFRDGDIFRMYYRGSHWDTAKKRATHPEFTCYAESKDGQRWYRPNLGIHEFNGSKANNIIIKGLGSHCFVAFKDANPDCPADARYKGLSAGYGKKRGLYAFKSADGVHFQLMHKGPVITKGAFDSQNLAFWDPISKKYVDYHRIFINGVRSIMTCTSDDFLHWTTPKLLSFGKAPKSHLYTNAIRPYPRAPHIRIGFPTRYLPKNQSVAPLFMSSRDGLNFKRFETPVIPQSAPQDRAGNRSNYMAYGLVMLPGKPKEYSVYATEAYYTGPDSRLRRFVYRVDGFVSMRGGKAGGQLITKTLAHSGQQLIVNYVATGGSLLVEARGEDGKAIPGFELSACQPLKGDSIAQKVNWKGGKLPKGKAIQLRFVLKNADLFSIRFR